MNTISEKLARLLTSHLLVCSVLLAAGIPVRAQESRYACEYPC